ncbi:50S ribosomal protein L28 [Senna tora]|uniref:50S ribosomal protein L28 n=1 Tax=Senna tora TaxID=362788 RepID=A0A834ST72_9FABA|nr:50S ribosomal protein L28 [Senna tora]
MAFKSSVQREEKIISFQLITIKLLTTASSIWSAANWYVTGTLCLSSYEIHSSVLVPSLSVDCSSLGSSTFCLYLLIPFLIQLLDLGFPEEAEFGVQLLVRRFQEVLINPTCLVDTTESMGGHLNTDVTIHDITEEPFLLDIRLPISP